MKSEREDINMSKKILLNGVDGNFGGVAAKVLLEKWPHEDLIFCAPTAAGLKPYEGVVETRVADLNKPEELVKAYSGADTMILISMPFIGEKRRKAHKAAIDAAVEAKVDRIVYTSIVGAGHPEINAYEVNDHIYTEKLLREADIHYVIMRNSQYAEAMVSIFLDSYENGGAIVNNMGEGKMAHISRKDCALAASCAAMSDHSDVVLEVNGKELRTITEFCEVGSKVTGKKVVYQYVNDEDQFKFFDSIGVPRTTEGEWAESAKNFPYCSEGMVTFGRAIRLNQMNTFTNTFKELTGQDPISLEEMFANPDEFLVGARTSTEE